MMMRYFFRALLAIAVSTAALAGCAPSTPGGPMIFAASSLQAPLEELAGNWQSKGHKAPVFSFASSTALARQIENGSFADIYISADSQWMDYIVTAGRIDPQDIKTLAANRIVLAAHKEAPDAALLDTAPKLGKLLKNKTVVSGDPDSVPLGRYAKQVLTSEDLWKEVGPGLIRAPSSSAALRLVLMREADFGILYASDVVRRDELIASPPFPRDAYAPILYKAVRLPSSGHPNAGAFLEYIASQEAAQVFRKYGFETP